MKRTTLNKIMITKEEFEQAQNIVKQYEAEQLEDSKPKCEHYKEGGGCRYSGVCPIYDRSKIKCSCGL